MDITMIGLRIKGKKFGITILYTKRPWVRKPVITMRCYWERTIFWCRSLEDQRFLASFLRYRGIRVETFNHRSLSEDEAPPVKLSMMESEKMDDPGLGCTVNVMVEEEIICELKEKYHLLFDKDGKWIQK